MITTPHLHVTSNKDAWDNNACSLSRPLQGVRESTRRLLPNHFGEQMDAQDTPNGHQDMTPPSRSCFTVTDYSPRNGIPSPGGGWTSPSEETILEQCRFQKLQREETRHKRLIKMEGSEVRHRTGGGESVEITRIPLSSSESKKISSGGYGQQAKLNPFYHRVELSFWDKLKIGLMTVTLVPLKVLLMIFFLAVALLITLVGMLGVTFEESQNKPLSTWRRVIRWIMAKIVMRAFVFCSGFVWTIKETAKIANSEEAPIFVVGPHSTYLDAFVVIILGRASPVARVATKDIPIFGKLVNFCQAVYVSRESKGSRRQTMEVLKQRAQGVYQGNGMPQIFIFPEGTCGNRSCLIKFKIGAFVPQVPVQPVLIRYPNRFDSCTWTFDGPTAAAGRNIWFALAQLFNRVEIEFLPVYKPSEEEKQDPTLYADNVRKVMAKALNVPLSDYTFEDGMVLLQMRQGKLPKKFHSIHRAKRALGLCGSVQETKMILEAEGLADATDYNLGFYDFQRRFFHVSSEDTTVPEVQTAFNCFKKNGGDKKEEMEVVDIRPYLVMTCLMYEERLMLPGEDLPRKACQMYGLKESQVTAEDLMSTIELLFEVKPEVTDGDAAKSSPSNAEINVQSLNDSVELRTSRILTFAKLFADEASDRLPKTYPSPQDKDKPTPRGNMKSD